MWWRRRTAAGKFAVVRKCYFNQCIITQHHYIHWLGENSHCKACGHVSKQQTKHWTKLICDWTQQTVRLNVNEIMNWSLTRPCIVGKSVNQVINIPTLNLKIISNSRYCLCNSSEHFTDFHQAENHKTSYYTF